MFKHIGAGFLLFQISASYQLCADNFFCAILDIIHMVYPFHLVFSFELFGNTLLCSHLFYQLRKHIFCLLTNVGQITIQLTAQP